MNTLNVFNYSEAANTGIEDKPSFLVHFAARIVYS